MHNEYKSVKKVFLNDVKEAVCAHLTSTCLGKRGRNSQRAAIPFNSSSGQVNTVILGILTLKPRFSP